MVGRVSRPKSSPFDQGLDTDVVVRLLDGTWEEADRRKYERCAWFQELKGFAIRYYNSCVLCGGYEDSTEEVKRHRLTVHHRHYRTLFDENMTQDVTVLCHRCHSKHHRGGRGNRSRSKRVRSYSKRRS